MTAKKKTTKKTAPKKKTTRKVVHARVVEKDEFGMRGLQHMAMDTAVLTGAVSMIPMVGAAFSTKK